MKNKENLIKEKGDIIIKIQNENKILEENLKIKEEQNNIKLKESEEKLINLEKKLTEKIKAFEEKLKNKEEQINKDKGEFNKRLDESKEINDKLKLEIEQYKKELIEKEKLLLNKERNIEKENISANNQEENSISVQMDNPEILQNLFSDVLLELNFSKFNLNLFDLLNKTLENYDKLKYFQNIPNNLNESSYDYLYHFYLHIKSYFIIGQSNTSLKDFLSQNSFIFSELNMKEDKDNDLSEKLKSLSLWKNNNVNELYEKKKEEYIKKLEIIFDSLKQKMINDINIENKNEIKKNKFIKTTEPKMKLEVNFDDLNKLGNLAKFQVFNSFYKLKELTLLISNFPLFLTYSLIVRCTDLNTLKIFFITEKSRSKNNENIENLCHTIPILIKMMNKLEAIELNNFPLKSNKIQDLVEALKTSKIKKLSLINCFPKKDGVTSLIPYFSFPNKTLIDINISEYTFNIISYLSNSIFNIQNNKNLTSINFTNCKLNEDDINHISNFIASSTSILSCDISKNILSPKSCSQFGYCVQKTTSLETLIMNECGINGESLPFLFNTKGSKCIKKIYLNDNGIGDIGLVSIGGFIKNSPEMEIVEVRNCEGTDMGFMNLANSIKVMKGNKLKYVNYLENNISSAALGVLIQFNEIFKNKGVVFALNKIEGETDKIKIDCAIFK